MKLGDVVRLVTCGPKMTVEGVGHQPPQSIPPHIAQQLGGSAWGGSSIDKPVRCVWFEAHVLHRQTFEESTLVQVDVNA